MKIKATILGALCAASVSAQVFTVDNFDTGDFSHSGSANTSQTLNESDVIGGVRGVQLFNNSGSSIAVSGGALTFTKTDSSIATLRYGDYLGDTPSESLGLPMGLGQFSVNVSSLSGPFTMAVDLRGDVGWRGQTKTISASGTTIFNVSEFTGANIDTTDIWGIQLSFTGAPSTLSLSGVTGQMSPIPEPSTYGLMFACLALSAVTVRRFTCSTSP